MSALAASQNVLDAVQVPYTTADEAYALMSTELERFIALVESLGPDDWDNPTACTAWDVRDILAHQAGAYASGTGYRQMFHQYTAMPKKGELPEDAINALQLRERDGKSPTELTAELRRVGPIAIRKWAYQFRLIKPIVTSHPVGGRFALRHLMWVVHSRDTWMHRLDICRATDRKFQQTREHDGRIVALGVRDEDILLRKKLAGQAVVFDLTGVAGGSYKVGAGEPAATIQMDALDFNIFASGRFTYTEARSKAILSGDLALAESAMKQTLLLY